MGSVEKMTQILLSSNYVMVPCNAKSAKKNGSSFFWLLAHLILQLFICNINFLWILEVEIRINSIQVLDQETEK